MVHCPLKCVIKK